MFKRLLQAAVLTFLIQLLASATAPTATRTTTLASQLESENTQIELHRLLKLATTRLIRELDDRIN